MSPRGLLLVAIQLSTQHVGERLEGAKGHAMLPRESISHIRYLVIPKQPIIRPLSVYSSAPE